MHNEEKVTLICHRKYKFIKVHLHLHYYIDNTCEITIFARFWELLQIFRKNLHFADYLKQFRKSSKYNVFTCVIYIIMKFLADVTLPRF